eukprot:c6407_g1_i1.p1 GENE.c6407_g1_i1~~c6407_g1_i1.p1  ORF type:complete len:292 (+),score=47.05 c6407_g1_i1:128-877(+)
MRQTFKRMMAASVMMAQRYNTLAQDHRVMTASMTGTCLAATGDLVAQKFIEKRENIDWRRTATYCAWICVVSAPFHTRLYMYWDRIWGESSLARIKKVCLDTFIVPLGYFPAFYLYKGAMAGSSISETLQDIRDRVPMTIAADYMFFLPASALNFTLVPPHLRASFLYCWEVVWSAVFSYIGFSDDPFSKLHNNQQPEEEQQQDGDDVSHNTNPTAAATLIQVATSAATNSNSSALSSLLQVSSPLPKV